jgi:hypothetical protein
MGCNPPFFPNSKNYEDDDEHDENARKLWFLILGIGLFTLKCVAKKFETRLALTPCQKRL